MIDYEKDCKRCGKCCSPGFVFKGRIVRFNKLKCKYLAEDNLCTIYDDRREIAGCYSPCEFPSWHMPSTCAFGGSAEESNASASEIIKECPDGFIGVLLIGRYKWIEEK